MKDARVQRLIKIVELMEANISANIGDTNEEDRNAFLDLMSHVYNLRDGYDEMFKTEADEKKPLTSENAEKLSGLYEKAIAATMRYTKFSPLYKNVEFEKEEKNIKSDLEDLKRTHKAISALTKNNAGAKSVYDIVTDSSHIIGTFKDDPNAKLLKATKSNTVWSVQDHSLKENVDRYVEGLNQMNTGFETHLKNVTGSKTNAWGVLESKLNAIQKALNDEYAPLECHIEVASLLLSHQMVHKALYVPEITSLTRENTINDHFTEAVLDGFLNEDQFGKAIDAGVAAGHINPKNAQIYKDEIHKIRFATYNLGMDPENIKALEPISDLLMLTNVAQKKFAEHSAGRDPLKNTKHPLNYAAKKGKIIEDKLTAYIRGEKGAQLPNDYDYSIYFDALGQYILSCDLLTKDGPIDVKNPLLEDCMVTCESIATLMPDYAPRLQTIKQGLTERYHNLFNEKLRIISEDTFTPAHPENPKDKTTKLSRAWNDVLRMYELKILSEEDYQLAYFTRMVRDDGFCQAQIEAAVSALSALQSGGENAELKDLPATRMGQLERPEKIKDIYRALIIGKLVDLEYSSVANYMNELPSAVNKTRYNIENPINKTIGVCLNKLYSMTDEDQRDMKSLYGTFIRSENVTQLMELSPAELSQLTLYPDNFLCSTLYGKGDDYIANLPKATYEALTQEKGTKYLNSHEYNDIARAMYNISMKSHTPGGVKSSDYLKLFNAGAEYLNIHQTKVNRPNSQLRIEAGRELVFTLGKKLVAESPDLAPAVEKKFYVNMLRCNEFRKMAMDDATNTIMQLSGGTGVVDNIKFNSMEAADKASLAHAIKIYAFGTMAEEMLKANGVSERIKGTLDEPGMEDALLAKYDAAVKFADKALDENYKDVMLSHGKKVETAKPELKAAREEAAEEKEARLELLGDMIEEFGKQISEAAAKGNDAEVLECTSVIAYLKTVEKNKELLSANDLKKALTSDNIKENADQYAPYAAKILNEMPTGTYNRLAENGGLGEYVEKRIKPMLKDSKTVKAEYDKNLAANNGSFKRAPEQAPVMAMK